MKNIILLFAALLLLSAWFLSDNERWKKKVAPELLQQLEAGVEQEFIILFRQQAELTNTAQMNSKEEKAEYVFNRLSEHAAHNQQGAIKVLENAGASYTSFFIVSAIYTKGSIGLVKSIASLEEVSRVMPNPTVKLDEPFPATNDNSTLNFRNELEWGLEQIGVQEVWDMGYSGQGVVLGGQDTGYEWDHPAIKEKYRGWDGSEADHHYNWHDAIHEINPLNGDSIIEAGNNPCGLDSLVPCDDNNHGTHTMGTMVGALSDEEKHIGVAPDAKWIACRNMERGWGAPASYIECFEWFLAPTDLNGENPDPSMAPHVIANSWSCPEIEGCNTDNFDLMRMAVDNLKASGVVVVVSAGNSGSSCSSVSTPAAIFEESFTVGATGQNDTIAGFSSRGQVMADSSGRLKPNVAAPGVGVRSCIRDGGYASYSGTSMAGPHVAGLVALIISANPELAGQVNVIENIVEQTAKPMLSEQDCGGFSGMEVPNAVYGFGRVNALAAVEAALSISNILEPEPISINVFPNPATESIRLEVSGMANNGTLEIFNLSGQRVYQNVWNIENERKTISITGWPTGVYVFRYQVGTQSFTGKITKI
jgi:subtilisin family serine protease